MRSDRSITFLEIIFSLNWGLNFYLEEMRFELEKYLRELEHYYRNEGANMPINGRVAFDHGLMSYRTSIEWCIKTREELVKSQKTK